MSTSLSAIVGLLLALTNYFQFFRLQANRTVGWIKGFYRNFMTHFFNFNDIFLNIHVLWNVISRLILWKYVTVHSAWTLYKRFNSNATFMANNSETHEWSSCLPKKKWELFEIDVFFSQRVAKSTLLGTFSVNFYRFSRKHRKIWPTCSQPFNENGQSVASRNIVIIIITLELNW